MNLLHYLEQKREMLVLHWAFDTKIRFQNLLKGRCDPLPLLVLLVFRHGARSSIAQEERLATSPAIGDKAPPATHDSSEVVRT